MARCAALKLSVAFSRCLFMMGYEHKDIVSVDSDDEIETYEHLDCTTTKRRSAVKQTCRPSRAPLVPAKVLSQPPSSEIFVIK